MNIKDVPEESIETSGKDLLQAMVNQQKFLMDKYHSIESGKGIHAPAKINIHTCLDQQRIKDFMWRVTEELGEAANCLKNKPWKQTEMPTDEDHFYEELSDALHFFLELLIMVGVDSAEKIFKLYMRKAKVNEFRQQTQY